MDNQHRVQLRRIYDAPRSDDGIRVLVDRLWPRGISKTRAHLDEWCKQIAPSTELRTWYHHAPDLFEEFSRRYTAELGRSRARRRLAHLKDLAAQQTLTLLTATKNPDISEAAVLVNVLTRGILGN